jgi:cupin fold WbuC family metalloprotein
MVMDDMTMIIDGLLLDKVTAQAKASPRLRMNYNFHQCLDEKCHRFLNAVEPGTVVPIHKHPTKDESFVLLRGRVRVTTHNDDGSIIEDVVLCAEEGRYGVDIPKNVWHNVECLESGSVFFECKEGPFSRLASSNERPEVERVEHEVEGLLHLSDKG